MTTSEPRPIFIVGSGRSGTTLLYNIVARHPALYGCWESSFFLYLPAIRRKFPNLHDRATADAYAQYVIALVLRGFALRNEPQKDEVEVAVQEVEALAAFAADSGNYSATFIRALDAVTRLSDRSQWVEKTPGHLFHVEALLAQVPDAVVIDVERDPRAVLLSHKRRRERYLKELAAGHLQREAQRFPKEYDPVRRSLEWRSVIRVGDALAASHAERYLRVRYEDLVRDPEATVRRVCTLAGLRYDPVMLDVQESNSSVRQDADAAEGISKASLNRWKEGLTPEELALCQFITRREMEQMGYPPAANTDPSRLGTITLALRSVGGWPRQLYRRIEYAGFPQLWSVAVGRLRSLFAPAS